MKKLILLLLAAAVATTAAAQAQRDTLTFNNDYYFSKRNVEELVPVTGQNIVMLGNSLTERGFWAEYFQGKRVLNRGIGGDCISGMINRVQPIVDGRPKAIFIMGGANDLLFSKISNEKLLQQYERLLDIIARETPRTRVYIQSLLPLNEAHNEAFMKGKNARFAEFNALLRAMAERRGLTFIDIWSAMQRNGELPEEYTFDGIHLKAAGVMRGCRISATGSTNTGSKGLPGVRRARPMRNSTSSGWSARAVCCGFFPIPTLRTACCAGRRRSTACRGSCLTGRRSLSAGR